jgi:hypothetical protein
MEAVVLTFLSKLAESVSTPFSLGSGGHQPVISSMACWKIPHLVRWFSQQQTTPFSLKMSRHL